MSASARAILESIDHEIHLSVASIWEIALKHRTGRNAPLREHVDAQIAANEFHVLPIERHHAVAVAALPLFHGDPFDALLVAQAQVEGMTILSRDPKSPATASPSPGSRP